MNSSWLWRRIWRAISTTISSVSRFQLRRGFTSEASTWPKMPATRNDVDIAPIAPARLGGAGPVLDRLEWLQPEPKVEGYTDADLNTLKAFGFKPPVKD
mgnify:CR=1 FL=1